MSDTDASEENIKSPSTYGKKGYQEYRKKERLKKKSDPEKEGLNTVVNYSKFAVGGESKEVPASPGLDENNNPIHRGEQNKPKQKNNRKKN